jgi:hypothetical protein
VVKLAALAFTTAGSSLAGQQQDPSTNPAGPSGTEPVAAVAEDETGLVQARLLPGEIRLDGVLDEEAWAGVSEITDFRQQDPDEGSPASFRTSVRMLFSSEALYVGARMEDPEPQRLIARILERDLLLNGPAAVFSGVGSDDDSFMLVLDTYDDNRNGFIFATNPNAAETDALLRDEGNLNLSWDGVWRVATAVDGGGWTAEFEIPFWTLRFADTPRQRWGVNFQRIVKRLNETDLWRSWTRDNGGLPKVSQAGALVGLADLGQGRNLQVKPFALAEGRRESLFGEAGLELVQTDEALDAGLDVKYGVTPNLTLDATLNTDFAQVEADVRQINLTRFSLFFPEKREFFLEGAGIFDFGARSFDGPPPALLFFSRRIGIEGGAEVPILGGAKLTGKEGPWTLGLLDVITDEERIDEEELAPRTNFGVARVLRELGSRSSAGAIFTHRSPAGDESSVALGLDTHVQISQTMAFDAFAATTDTPGSRGETGSYRAALDFTADRWGWFVEQLYIGPGFEPTVGFVLRDDINRQFATFRVTPRPDVLDIRRIDLRLNATFISSADWEIRDRDYRFSVTPQLNSGDRLELAIGESFTRLTEPFELDEEVVFPTGDYDGANYEAALSTSANRLLSGELFANRFAFFSGRNVNVGGRLLLSASRNLSLEGNWSHNDIRSAHGDLETDLLNLRVNYAFSTHLFTNALIQYDSTEDEIDVNVRLNLIHSPGSDLFIVLNEQRGADGDPWGERDRALVVKFTKLFNL